MFGYHYKNNFGRDILNSIPFLIDLNTLKVIKVLYFLILAVVHFYLINLDEIISYLYLINKLYKQS